MPKKKGPWTVLGGRTVYKSPWMEVREDRVINPAGKPGRYGTIKLKSGVTVIPLDKEGGVYLTREFHYGTAETSLEGISGGQEKGQSPLQAAKRELLEEVGLEAKKWTPLGKAEAFTTYLSSPMHLYLAEELSHHDPQPDESEKIEIVKMPLRKALRLVKNGGITHAATIITLFKIATLKRMPIT